jgi:hypothetical protein
MPGSIVPSTLILAGTCGWTLVIGGTTESHERVVVSKDEDFHGLAAKITLDKFFEMPCTSDTDVHREPLSFDS